MHQCSKVIISPSAEMVENLNDNKSIKKKGQTKSFKEIIKPYNDEKEKLKDKKYNLRGRKEKNPLISKSNDNESEEISNSEENVSYDHDEDVFFNKKRKRKFKKKGRKKTINVLKKSKRVIINLIFKLAPKKLNGRKIISDSSDSNDSDNELNGNQISEGLEQYIKPNSSELDFLELRDPKKINEIKIEASKTLIEAQKEIKKLEVEFLVNEDKIESNYCI